MSQASACPSFVLLLLLLFFKCVLNCDPETCPKDRDNIANTGPLRLAQNLSCISTVVRWCEGHYLPLDCYVAGFSQVQWYIYKRNRWMSIDYSNSSYLGEDEFTLDNHNTCLSLKNPFIERHSSRYKCVAKGNHGKSLSRELQLTVMACGNHGIVAVEEQPQSKYLRLPGTSVTFSCKASFDRPDTSVDNIVWQYFDGSRVRYVKHLGSKYNVSKSISIKRHVTVLATLTIINIGIEDYRLYRCHIASNIDTRDQRSYNVHLDKGDPDDPDGTKHELMWLGIGAGIFLFVTVILAVVCYTRRLDLRLWWIYHIQARKTPDEKENDVAIIYNEHDERDDRFVHDILRPGLSKLGYTVYGDDCYLGQSNIQIYTRALETSRRFIVVLTPAALSTPWCQLKSEEALHEYGKCIIFVILEPIDKQTWSKDAHTRSIQKAVQVIKKCVQYPVKDSKVPLFWKKLQLYLPIVDKTVDDNPKHNEKNSVSSGRPLLSSLDHSDSGKGSSAESGSYTSSERRDTMHSEDDVFVNEYHDGPIINIAQHGQHEKVPTSITLLDNDVFV